MNAIARLNEGLAGRYRVEREIGAGGMATVFLARDLRHDRHVALKVLRPELAAAIGAERFLSEIRVTAKLQHPNLLPLFDSGESDGLLYYMMPYVDGESLRQRLDREKQLPVEEAVRLTIAICSALDYAHRHGVIHRDLKPENVLLHDGQPVIADFGIALAISNAGGSRLTQTGISLGTPQYMSPEQASGDRAIDARTDIYSVGAVLYEMLAGEAPHTGPTSQAIIGKLMTEDPQPVRSLRRSVPAHVDGAVHRALEKLPADRFTTASDLSAALSAKPVEFEPSTNAHSRSIKRITLVAAGVAAVSLAASAWSLTHRPSAAAPAQRFQFSLALPDTQALDGTFFRSLDLSPDGSKVVYTGLDGLFIRPLDSLTPRRLTSEPASEPKFSPDGAWVAYISNSTLRKVPVAGGKPTTIVDSVGRFGWSSKGIIVFIRSGHRSADLWRVGENGDSAVRFVHQRRPNDVAYGTPSFLPDGDTFLVPLAVAGGAETELVAYRFSDDTMRYLGLSGGHPIYVDGFLLYLATTDGIIAAVPFDAQSLHQIGEPTPVLSGVMPRLSSAELAISSMTGTMAYLPRAVPGQLFEFDRDGRQYPLPFCPAFCGYPRYSPDGRQVAVVKPAPSGGTDVWIYDMSLNYKQQLSESHRAWSPEWTPDGKRLGWTDIEFGVGGQAWEMKSSSTFWRSVNRSDTASLVVKGGLGMVFSRDGSFAVVGISDRRVVVITKVQLDSTGRRTAIDTAKGPPAPRVSPDGRFIAYVSQQSGLSEVYVRPLNRAGVAFPVSSGGGTEPMWGQGRKLFYRSGSRLVAATLSPNYGPPVTPHDTLAFRMGVPGGPWANYDVSPNGQRFLTVAAVGGDQPIVITNWLDVVREKLKKPK